MAVLTGPDLAVADQRPVAADTAAIACVLLCVSTPITIISVVLSLDATYGRTSGGQSSLGAKPRSYQVTPEILGRQRATRPMRSDLWPTGSIRVSPLPAREPTEPAGRQTPTEPQR